MIATMAMGSLSKQAKEPNMLQALAGVLNGAQPQAPSGGLGGLVTGLLGGGQQHAAPQPQGALGMLGGLLDADGDGSPMDDIFKMVMSRK